MKGSKSPAAEALAGIARSAGRRRFGDRAPEEERDDDDGFSVTVAVGKPKPDPDAEVWGEASDDDEILPGSIKHRGRG